MAHQETICRVVHQYSRGPVPERDMKKLMEIAQDYRQVKNYVYVRYGGRGSLSKLYPGYTVQNEMTGSGLRDRLGMPSVYFYRAISEALGDIKTQWAQTKAKVLRLTAQNQNLTPEEKHYLRFLLRSGNAFEAVLNQQCIRLPDEMQTRYDELAAQVDTEKMHKYLCRQVRKYHVRRLHTDSAEGFAITERAYRYGEDPNGPPGGGSGGKHGIFLATKEKRKRVFIPLTDENAYEKQLYIKLKPEEERIEIDIPMETKIRTHKDYKNEIGLSAGMWHMFTTDQGHVYGEDFGELHRELTEYVSAADRAYRRERHNNAGRRKYRAGKARLDARIETYVNQEINRMLAEEKPRLLYIPRLPRNRAGGYSGKTNHSVTLWKRGFIRERLKQKCKEHSVEIVEVMGKGISTECSRCGAQGTYGKDIFRCGSCGFTEDKKINAARNAIERGRRGQRIHAVYVDSEESGGTGQGP